MVEIIRYFDSCSQRCISSDVPVPVGCFASLILRHTQQADLMKRAGLILQSMAEFAEQNSSAGEIELIARFAKENDAAVQRILVDQQIQRILVDSACQPELWVDARADMKCSDRHGDMLTVDESVRSIDDTLTKLMWPSDPGVLDQAALRALADACRRATAGDRMFADFTTKYSEETLRKIFLESQGPGFVLLSDLRQSMAEHGLLDSPARIVLSLSGGVDSIVHLALLWVLKNMCGHSFHIACLHLSYPNRDSDVVRSEEEWVRHTCRSLGVPLYGFRNPLRRPHLGEQTGLTREEYEDVCKRFRFKMYQCVASKLAVSEEIDPACPWVVMVGHHQDDIDENRLAELGKANLVYINGVKSMSYCLGTRVFRPLLNTRKQALLQLAKVLPLAYMADSTPKWSRRGWIRRLLDDCIHDKNLFLSLLKSAGDASECFGDLLDHVVSSWKRDCVGVRETESLDVPIVVVLDLSPLINLDLLRTLDEVITQTRSAAAKVALIWNPAVSSAEIAHRESYTSCEDDMPPSCPLNQISAKITKDCGKVDAAGGMVICRAFYSLHDDTRTAGLLGDKALSRKGLLHLWELLRSRQRSRTPYIRGSLHQQVHYTMNPKSDLLVIHAPANTAESRSIVENFTARNNM